MFSSRVREAESTVATVLTVYGIETLKKRGIAGTIVFTLQQYLPFTVLKPISIGTENVRHNVCCNSTYRLRY